MLHSKKHSLEVGFSLTSLLIKQQLARKCRISPISTVVKRQGRESKVGSQELGVKSWKLRVKSQESRVKSQKSRVKSQESRVKSQEWKVKSQN